MEPTIPTDATLLAAINDFCAQRTIPPTTFGRLAIGDGNLVANLRAGRSPTLKVANRIVDFMVTYQSETEAA